MVKLILYQHCSTQIVLPALTNTVTKALISDATVTATLYDYTGTAVDNYTDLPMAAVVGTPGSYSMVVQDLDLDEGSYYFIFTGEDTHGNEFEQRQEVEVRLKED